MITFGAQFGGPELKESLIRRTVMRASQIAQKARSINYSDGTEAWINPIFIVPGSLLKPQFEGYKLGHFSPKKKGLVVQIAVPQSVADGQGVLEFISSSLREAAKMAEARFASKGISFSVLKAEQIIIAIETGLKRVEY